MQYISRLSDKKYKIISAVYQALSLFVFFASGENNAQVYMDNDRSEVYTNKCILNRIHNLRLYQRRFENEQKGNIGLLRL